jgi:hypothetical protein
MTSVKGFTERANQIAENANSLGAGVTVNVMSDSHSVKITFVGTDINGKRLKHPLSCGHIHFPIQQLGNEQFLDGMFDAVGTVLMGRTLSPMQAIYLPIGPELLSELLSVIGDLEGNIEIHIVTKDDIEDQDLPPYIKDMLKDRHPRRSASPDDTYRWN